MGIDRDMSFEKFGVIPGLEEISDRFYDINAVISVEVSYRGYVVEIKAVAPFKGLATIKSVINMLNKDINVIVKDTDLVKLRNSIIYYNEYFCPSEANENESKPALVAFDRVETSFNRLKGIVEKNNDDKNPFKTNVLKDIVKENNHTRSDIDDAMERYISEKKKNELKMQSTVTKRGGLQVPTREVLVTMHSTFSQNLSETVNLDQFEKCYENCEFL